MVPISVIIPCYNARQFLERCLNSVFAEDEKMFEIILIDDGSTDGTPDFIKAVFGKRKNLKLITNKENVGSSQTKNIGVKNSQGEYLFFLDSDTKVKPGWSKTIPQFFENHKRAGLIQAKLLRMETNSFDYAGDLISHFGFLIERARGVQDQGQFDQAKPIFGLKTAGAIMKKTVFEAINGFDPDYHIFWEDTDIAWRTWLAGFEVLFCPDITVWHASNTPEKTNQYYQERERAYQISYFGCRNMLSSLIKNLELKMLIFVLPINISCWLILSILFLFRLNPKKSLEILKGIGWNLIFLQKTLNKRKRIQTARMISDQKLFSLVGTKKGPDYYFNKAIAYIENKPFY